MRRTVAALTSGSGDQPLIIKTAYHTVKAGTYNDDDAPVCTGVVRVSSITVASESPFVVRVSNAAGSFTTYKIAGQKPTKIVLPRETSTGGNPALFNAFNTSSSTTTYPIVSIADNGNIVDAMINCVVDSNID